MEYTIEPQKVQARNHCFSAQGDCGMLFAKEEYEMTEITVNIRKFRKKAGLSQSDLAEKLNVTRQTVSSWENGKTYPDLEMVVQLSEVLGTDPNHLLYPERNKKSVNVKYISAGWILLTMFLFFLELTLGGGWWWIPMFSKILGGGIAESFLYPIYGGIILLAGLMIVCTSLIIDEMRDLKYKNLDDE